MKEGGNKGQAVPPSVFIKDISNQINLSMLGNKKKYKTGGRRQGVKVFLVEVRI